MGEKCVCAVDRTNGKSFFGLASDGFYGALVSWVWELFRTGNFEDGKRILIWSWIFTGTL